MQIKRKSYFLSKITKFNFSSGTSIRNERLTIQYTELEAFENRKILLLDFAYLQTLVLRENEEKDVNW